MAGPKISSLVVSGPRRLPYLPTAVAAWDAQTWPDRELVVVWDGDPDGLDEALGVRGRRDVRIVVAPPGQTLGALRNRSLDAASGDLLCQWDDDDLYHPERLQRQAEHLLGSGRLASYLGNAVGEDIVGKRAFWLDFDASPDPAGRMHHGTVMMRRGLPVRYPESGPSSRRGEDTVVLWQLLRLGPHALLRGEGALYVYRWHGGNTVPNLHFARLVAFTTAEAPTSARPRFDALAPLGGPSFDALGTRSEAIALYASMLAGSPESPERSRHEALEAIRRGDLAGARRILERLMREGGADPASVLALSGLYQGEGILGQARPLLGQALQDISEFPRAAAALGTMALAEGRPDEAVASFDRAWTLAPWDPIVANDRGVALARAGRPDEALAAFRDAIGLEPDRPAPHDNLLRLLPDAAARVREYDALAQRFPDARAIAERHAAVLWEAGHKERAVAALQHLRSLSP